jgi:tRNA-dihydrouridine synthase B
MPVDKQELAGVIRRHAQLARRWSPHLALLKMRTFVPRYVKSMEGARALRQEIVKCMDWESLNAILEKYFGAELDTEL